MRGIASADEDLLYRLFGVDAELLIDHAWGRESVTIADIKAFQPKHHSLSSSQILPRDYSYEEGRLIVKEMAELLCFELVDKGLITDSITLQIGFAYYLEKEPVRGTIQINTACNLAKLILPYADALYERIVDKTCPIRRVSLSFSRVYDEVYQQYDLFCNPKQMERERAMQKTALEIKKRFGKNAVFKGMNLEKAGTTLQRNRQIGGHKSGE